MNGYQTACEKQRPLKALTGGVLASSFDRSARSYEQGRIEVTHNGGMVLALLHIVLIV